MASQISKAQDRCRGCGLPPRETDGVLIRLKRCSRCKQAWYHDADCQRKDLKRHRRQECKSSEQPITQSQNELFHVEKREGRGNCLVASSPLKLGCILLEDKQPLVPPVLRHEYSLQRCAACFGKLKSRTYQFKDVAHCPQYPVVLCSELCLKGSISWLREEEVYVSKILAGGDSPIRVFATTILLYRMVRAASFLRTLLLSLLSCNSTSLVTMREGQTFVYGIEGILPAIRLTVCDENGITAGDEICISYIDSTAVRPSRQKMLQDAYYFRCSCQRCACTEEPTGLRCVSCQDVFVVADAEGYRCLSCGETNFADAKNLIQRFHHLREKATSDEYLGMLESFEKIFLTSSWYFQECGDRCLQAILDDIGCCSSEADRMTLCRKALSLCERLLLSGNKGSGVLRMTMLLYKCSKLRLYVQPDPSVAIGELQQCLQQLLVLYPPNHEVIIDLTATIRQVCYNY
ncbi:methyltransferase [Fragilaria crotonensis]|nr:methyltransferase [Fragilaria crotonensis]